MCGIFALSGKKLEEIADNSIQAAFVALSHRGPDDKGVVRLPQSILGQTRLSIVDLASGHQPMKDNISPHTIVFNGEIYGYKDIREELQKRGHTFSTQSDTEVILKAYKEYGEQCVEHLDGMFAFALWDEEKQQLFLARDRFGKKPLYYAFDTKERLVVASEIKALFALDIKGELDLSAIDDYLTLMYIPPWRSVYKNIHVLLPAHSAIYRNGEFKTKHYWKLEYKPISPSYEEAKEEVRRLFTESVRKRMIADVEIGAFLSGGVDSTLVASYAQKFATHPLKTFALGYGDFINELPFAKEAAEKIGTDHYSLQATSKLTNELEKILTYFDEPHADSSDFPQHLISELAGSKVKVALSGDGGDELFLGYGWYTAYWNTRKIVRLKNMLLSNPFKEHIRSITVFPKSWRRKLWKYPVVMKEQNIERLAKDISQNGVQKMNLFDITTYLPGQLLSKIDQASMMHSLEVRCPFLDYKLAEYVYNLPQEFKLKGGIHKILLKDLLAEIMPSKFVHRKKQGFGAPVRLWLETEPMQKYVREKLGSDAKVYQYLHKKAVDALLVKVYNDKDLKSYYRLWVLLCLELWLELHPQTFTN